MPTKDPHIAVIDAQEELHHIKMQLKAAVARVQQMAVAGIRMSADDLDIIERIQQKARDATERVQDRLWEELNGHGQP